MGSMAAFTLGEWGGLVVDYQEILVLCPLSRVFQLIWEGSVSRWGENGRVPKIKKLAQQLLAF